MPISISQADKAREQLTKVQQQRIRALYLQASKDIEKQLSKLDESTTSGVLRSKYLKNLQKQVNESLENVGKEVEALTRANMLDSANLIGSEISKWLVQYEVDLTGSYSHVAEDIVESLVTGTLYDGDWTLSNAVWKNVKSNQEDIEMIVAKGVAENKSVVDIAKDLANYTNPHKLIKWNLKAPDGRRILRTSVDYNAQRLARTMVSHAYQQSFIRATEKNPFVIDYIWVSSNGGRSCPLCMARDGEHYKKGDLPVDHPNGMCTWIVNTVSDDEIISQLSDWVNGGDNDEIDSYVESLGYTLPKSQQSYAYHATKSSSLNGIIEKGLKPNDGHFGKGIYFANSPEDAVEWTTGTSTGGKTVLRVAKDKLKGISRLDEYAANETSYGMAELVFEGKVPMEMIEIKVGDEWWSLAYYAEQRRNLHYNKLSKAAQKRVDKVVDKELEEYFKRVNSHK